MLWIFAYGSRMFRPAFAFAAREPALIEGYERRFWQGSTDHRGVPGAPGRVATLVASPGARCHGIAFGVRREDAPAVLDGLDFRERGGYSRLELPMVSPADGAEIGVGLVYVATPNNEEWLGPAPVHRIAAQVRASAGPSGRNIDYVLGVARVLFEPGADDDHLFELANLLVPWWRDQVGRHALVA